MILVIGFRSLQIAAGVEVIDLRQSRTCLRHAHFNCLIPDIYDTLSRDQSDNVSWFYGIIAHYK